MKTRTIIAAMFVTLVPIPTCGSQAGSQQVISSDDHIYYYGDANYDKEDEEPTVERTLNLKDFKAIQNNFFAEVQYTPSSQYSVKVTGSQKVLDATVFCVKDGVLCIDVTPEYKSQNTNIHKGVCLYVSSPNLERISNSCSLAIHANQWKLKELDVENSSALSFKVNDLDCQSLNISNSGAFSYEQGHVKAANVYISNSGASAIDLTFSVKNTFDLANSGACKLLGSVKAGVFSESCSGSVKDEANIIAEKLDLDISGAGTINSTFKGKTAFIKGSGLCKINMTVDCEKLSIEADGLSEIKVKGTADDATFKNNGMTKVDASELNKF